MPFKSERQRRYLWKFHPDIARRWTEEEKLKRNPPSKGFQWLNAGTFSDIYRKGFRVEALIYQDRHGHIDLSKDIMVSVRDKVSENAKRFIPDIHRKRIDINSDGLKEFIYEMPYYESCDDYNGFDKNEKISGKTTSVEEQVSEISKKKSQYSLDDEDIEGIEEALIAFRLEAESMGLNFVNDMRNRNLVKKGDQLILLDTFYAADDSEELIISRWNEESPRFIRSMKQLLKSLTQNL